MDETSKLNLKAMVVWNERHQKWEVKTAISEGVNCHHWRHKRFFQTEQEAEIYARKILPYSDTNWHLPEHYGPQLTGIHIGHKFGVKTKAKPTTKPEVLD
jgi:hypothetical protein